MKPNFYTELYNKEQKEKFLNERYSNLGTQKDYKLLFLKSYALESFHNKDLANFAHDQLSELWDLLNCKTFDSLYKYQTIVRKYMEWAISNGKRASALDMTDLFNKQRIRGKINKIANQAQYIKSREEMYQICDQIYNKRDAALLVCFYEGLKIEHIQALKTKDCNWNKNQVTITYKDGRKRILEFNSKSMEILKDASEETTYHQDNGNSTYRLAIKELDKSDKLFKTVKRNDNKDSIANTAISSLFTKIGQWVDKPYLNPKNVIQSGILEKLSEIESKNGKLTPTDFRRVSDMYSLNPKSWAFIQDLWLTYKSSNNL